MAARRIANTSDRARRSKRGTASTVNKALLVVEDDPRVREVTSQVLSLAGYSVLKAATANAALTTFRRYGKKLQLVITDLVLPGKDGRALAAEMKAVRPELKILLTSGYPETALNTSAIEGIEYLSKPFSADSLLNKVHQVLR